MSKLTPEKAAAFKASLDTLTPFEAEAVKQAFLSSAGNGHDFGYSSDISVPGAKNNGGILSSLIKKGILEWDREYGQIAFVSFYGESYEAAEIVKAKFSL
jgi:hypothetical protein